MKDYYSKSALTKFGSYTNTSAHVTGHQWVNMQVRWRKFIAELNVFSSQNDVEEHTFSIPLMYTLKNRIIWYSMNWMKYDLFISFYQSPFIKSNSIGKYIEKG